MINQHKPSPQEIPHLKSYRAWLRLEQNHSENTIEAYVDDIRKLFVFLNELHHKIATSSINTRHIQQFLKWINELGLGATTQARILSGIKSYFRFLVIDEILKSNPAELIETPRTARKLPVVLSLEEIDRMIATIDKSKDQSQRNHAIIETLYGCGLRVSELTNLKITNLHFGEGFIRVIGKGNHERLIPIGKPAMKEITTYLQTERVHIDIKKGEENYVFLNRRGHHLTRAMIFTIIRELAQRAGVTKTISPHTFRHSFATHMVENGADLRVVQEMLGHKSILTTEIYTHLDRHYLRESIIEYHPHGID